MRTKTLRVQQSPSQLQNIVFVCSSEIHCRLVGNMLPEMLRDLLPIEASIRSGMDG
jgi:hypothetical protein